MKSEVEHRRSPNNSQDLNSGILGILLCVSLVLVVSPLMHAASDRIEVAGEESYTYGDNESLVAAKETARSLAIKRAIESYQVFVDATSTVKDYQLVKDLIMTISSGYLHDMKIEQFQEGRTIHIKVRGYVVPSEIKAVLEQALNHPRAAGLKDQHGGDLDCPDFPSQAAAQAELRAHPSDPHRLDRNRDGIACEKNPPPYDKVPVLRPRQR